MGLRALGPGNKAQRRRGRARAAIHNRLGGARAPAPPGGSGAAKSRLAAPCSSGSRRAESRRGMAKSRAPPPAPPRPAGPALPLRVVFPPGSRVPRPLPSQPRARDRPAMTPFPRAPPVANTPQKREGPRSRGSGAGQWAAGGGAECPAQPHAVTGRAARRQQRYGRRFPRAGRCHHPAVTAGPSAPTFRPCSPRRGGTAG